VKIKEMYDKLSKSERIIFFVAAGFVGIALLDAIVLGPIYSRMSLMDAEIEAKKETIKRNLRITSFRDSIVGEYTGYKNYLDSADKVREEIIGDLLKKIEVIAGEHKISILNIQPGDIIENPVFQEYKTTLQCEGTFADTLAFMRDLENSEFLFKIPKYSMIPKSKGGEVLTSSMDINRIFITAEKREGVPEPEAVLEPPAGESEAGAALPAETVTPTDLSLPQAASAPEPSGSASAAPAEKSNSSGSSFSPVVL